MRWKLTWLAPPVLTTVLALAPAPAYARSAELLDPPPIAVPAGLSQAQVASEIRRALQDRGWAVNQERPGEIEATLYLRGHEVRIAITHDARDVRIAYLASANLDYEEAEGKRWIHSNYTGWIGFLSGDLQNNLRAAQSNNG